MNRDWTGKLQVILLSAEKIVLAHSSEEVNRDAFWENEAKIHERECIERVFFVNLQAAILQLHYRLTSSKIVFRDFKYLLRF